MTRYGGRGRYRRTNLQPCGTPAAWRRHHYRGEYPCIPCADAWNAYVTAQRAERRRQARRRSALYVAAREGLEPAEALSTGERRRLVTEFVVLGMTDLEIAELTRMTLYTTARIRRELGLEPNERRGDIDLPAAS